MLTAATLQTAGHLNWKEVLKAQSMAPFSELHPQARPQRDAATRMPHPAPPQSARLHTPRMGARSPRAICEPLDPTAQRRALDCSRAREERSPGTLMMVLNGPRLPAHLGKKIDPVLLSPRARALHSAPFVVREPSETVAREEALCKEGLTLFTDKSWFLFPSATAAEAHATSTSADDISDLPIMLPRRLSRRASSLEKAEQWGKAERSTGGSTGTHAGSKPAELVRAETVMSADVEHKMTREHVVQLISEVRWFSKLSPEGMSMLYKRCSRNYYTRYSTLIREGNVANSFYLLLKGKVHRPRFVPFDPCHPTPPRRLSSPYPSHHTQLLFARTSAPPTQTAPPPPPHLSHSLPASTRFQLPPRPPPPRPPIKVRCTSSKDVNMVTVLTPGASFGEAALVARVRREATVGQLWIRTHKLIRAPETPLAESSQPHRAKRARSHRGNPIPFEPIRDRPISSDPI